MCDAENRWILYDGVNDKKSTNGTWYYIKEDTEVTDGMALKANLTIFDVNLNPPTQSWKKTHYLEFNLT